MEQQSSEKNKSSEEKQIPIKVALWVIIVLLIIGVAGYALYVVYFQLNPEVQLVKITKKTTEEQKNTQEPQEKTKETGSEAQPEPIVDEYAGWLTFTNENYGYEIKYPQGGKISYAGQDEAGSGSYCVEIKNTYNYIIISKDPNKICLRTGVGAEYSPIQETITIEEKEYTANGFKTQSASAGYYEEFLAVKLDDGTEIEYGINVNEKYGQGNYNDAKAEVIKMVKSYKSL